jgi:hypothetical protein
MNLSSGNTLRLPWPTDRDCTYIRSRRLLFIGKTGLHAINIAAFGRDIKTMTISMCWA